MGLASAGGASGRGSWLGRLLLQAGRLCYYVGLPVSALWRGGLYAEMGIPTTLAGNWASAPLDLLLALTKTSSLADLGQATALSLATLALLLGIWIWYARVSPLTGDVVCPTPWWEVIREAVYAQMLWAFYRGIAAQWMDDPAYASFAGLAVVGASWVLNPLRRHRVDVPVVADWILALEHSADLALCALARVADPAARGAELDKQPDSVRDSCRTTGCRGCAPLGRIAQTGQCRRTDACRAVGRQLDLDRPRRAGPKPQGLRRRRVSLRRVSAQPGPRSPRRGDLCAQLVCLLDGLGLRCIGGFECAVECFSAPAQRAENHARIADNARLIAELGGGSMVVGTDGPPNLAEVVDPIGQMAEVFAGVADRIDETGVTLCIEFNWSPLVKSLRTAAEIARRSGQAERRRRV